MADRLKPEHVEIVDKIRVLEDEIVTAKQRFKNFKTKLTSIQRRWHRRYVISTYKK